MTAILQGDFLYPSSSVYAKYVTTAPLRGGCWTSGLVWMQAALIERVSVIAFGSSQL